MKNSSKASRVRYSILSAVFVTVVIKEEKNGRSKEEKIVTATKKGAAVLDQGIPDQIKAHYHVLQQASICS